MGVNKKRKLPLLRSITQIEFTINANIDMQKKIIGYVLLGLSCMTWIFIPFIGLLNLTMSQSAILLTTLIVLGEGCFLLSIFFLGKEIWQKIKQFFKAQWQKIIQYFHKDGRT